MFFRRRPSGVVEVATEKKQRLDGRGVEQEAGD